MTHYAFKTQHIFEKERLNKPRECYLKMRIGVFLKYFLLILLSNLFCVFCSADFPIVKDGTLYFKGQMVDTKFEINETDIGVEGGVLFRSIPNVDKSLELLKIISKKGAVEIWLFGCNTCAFPVLLDTFVTDFNLKWYSKNYVATSRSSMGTSISYIYKINSESSKIAISKAINNLLFFDPVYELIVSLDLRGVSERSDVVIIENPFSREYEEHEILLNYKYLSDAFNDVKVVKFDACTVSLVIGENESGYAREIKVQEALCNSLLLKRRSH